MSVWYWRNQKCGLRNSLISWWVGFFFLLFFTWLFISDTLKGNGKEKFHVPCFSNFSPIGYRLTLTHTHTQYDWSISISPQFLVLTTWMLREKVALWSLSSWFHSLGTIWNQEHRNQTIKQRSESGSQVGLPGWGWHYLEDSDVFPRMP